MEWKKCVFKAWKQADYWYSLQIEQTLQYLRTLNEHKQMQYLQPNLQIHYQQGMFHTMYYRNSEIRRIKES